MSLEFDNLKNCTIIIPTYNRPRHLKTLLDYYNHSKISCRIIIADSSDEHNKAISHSNTEFYSELKIQYLNHYTSSVQPLEKIRDAITYSLTKYTLICPDDDFITPNGITESIIFLETHPDYSVAQGIFTT